MKKICKHAYPSDLCGTCNPPAKEKVNDRLAPTAGSPSSTPETDAKSKWCDEYQSSVRVVESEFARALEVERNQLRHRLMVIGTSVIPSN